MPKNPTCDRYEQPTFTELDEMYGGEESDIDEINVCLHCMHCFELTERQRDAVIGAMPMYGKWHEHERQVCKAVNHALKGFGVCEVKGELVDLTGEPCDHYADEAD